MSESKKSKVVKCKFIDTWQNPKGGTVYYHELTLDNGEIGNCGTMEKYADKITEGVEIHYKIDGNRIKLVQVQESGPKASSESKSKSKPSQKSQGVAKSSSGYSNAAKKVGFLGYSYSYAKDLVVAGKTSKKDRDNLREIAEEIYGHIGDILDGKLDAEKAQKEEEKRLAKIEAERLVENVEKAKEKADQESDEDQEEIEYEDLGDDENDGEFSFLKDDDDVPY